jgi:hypothetical protein
MNIRKTFPKSWSFLYETWHLHAVEDQIVFLLLKMVITLLEKHTVYNAIIGLPLMLHTNFHICKTG